MGGGVITYIHTYIHQIKRTTVCLFVLFQNFIFVCFSVFHVMCFRSSSLPLTPLWSLCLLVSVDNSICHHKKSFTAACGNPHPPPPFVFNNLGLHKTSFMFGKPLKQAGRDSRWRACRSTPPSLPSASWPQLRPRHQRQVEWNHEITGKVSITLWNQALSKSRQDPTGPWN